MRLRRLRTGDRRAAGGRARPRGAARSRNRRREDAEARRNRSAASHRHRSDRRPSSSSAPTPSALVERAADAGAYGYLTKPFKEDDLLPAIATARARFKDLTALREEALELAEALAARKAIERAKGILMEKDGLTEAQAFARLRKASQTSGRPMRLIAEALIETLS